MPFKPENLSSSPAAPEWKERGNSPKLSSHLHTYIEAYVLSIIRSKYLKSNSKTHILSPNIFEIQLL